jgi:enoyl-CoA hydratase/carnithine racemase
MTTDDVLYEAQGPVATVTLNRPEKLNAFTHETLRHLRAAVGRAVADPAVVGIIVTGAGRGFCAGLDASVLAETTSRGSSARSDSPRSDTARSDAARSDAAGDELPGIFTWLLDVDKPMIAAVNGVAAGGGLVLAAMSDVRFASRQASFTTIFSKRGLIAEHGTSWILPRLVGAGRALDLLWTSRRIDAEEAYRIGLVDYLTDADDLLVAARHYIEELAAQVSPASLRDTKRLVYRHLGVGYPEAVREADEYQWASLDRPDAKEGALALAERRPARFDRLGHADVRPDEQTTTDS